MTCEDVVVLPVHHSAGTTTRH